MHVWDLSTIKCYKLSGRGRPGRAGRVVGPGSRAGTGAGVGSMAIIGSGTGGKFRLRHSTGSMTG